MLAPVDELHYAIRIEPNHKIVAVRYRGNASTSGQCTPFTQQVDVFGDVQLLEVATLLFEPILGRLAIGSRRRRVDTDLVHD